MSKGPTVFKFIKTGMTFGISIETKLSKTTRNYYSKKQNDKSSAIFFHIINCFMINTQINIAVP